jgi:hypothetical protein
MDLKMEIPGSTSESKTEVEQPSDQGGIYPLTKVVTPLCQIKN